MRLDDKLRGVRHLVFALATALLAGHPASTAFATGELDTFSGVGWSPNSEWLAFNWPDKNELFFISLKTRRSYSIKPLGAIDIDVTGVFSAEAPIKTMERDPNVAKVIPSPGFGKLRMLGWSPDSRLALYQTGRKQRATFSTAEAVVKQRLDESSPMPWAKPDELRVTFELFTATAGRPTRYRMRVQRADGTVAKEITFEEPREVRQLGIVRYRGASFLSPDGQFLLYPRVSGAGWQLMREPARGDGKPEPVTSPGATPPYEWKLTRDGRHLAVADLESLRLSALDEPAGAQTIPLRNRSIAMAWSHDGQFLAYNDRQSLFLVKRGTDKPALVSDSCSPRFWGWRGAKLYFGDAVTDSTNLFEVDPEQQTKPEQIVKARHWDTAPREVSVSPDGTMLVAVATYFDGEGRPVPRLWKIDLRPDAKWEVLYSLRP